MTTYNDLREVIELTIEMLMAQPASTIRLEPGTRDWEWTEMTDPDADVDQDDMPKTQPKRI